MKHTAGSSLNVMPLPPAADAAKLFQEYLDATSLAPNTVLAYSSSVRQFFRLYKEITPDTLHLYKAYLMEHYRPQTVNLRIRAVNSYIECFHLPVSRLPAIRIQQKLYAEHVISEADYEYLKSRFIQDEKYVYYFIVRYMAATGARVSELTQIKAEHLDLGYMDLYSKGGKIRRIYFPDALRNEASLWFHSKGVDAGFLFTNRRGVPMTSRGISGQLKKLAIRYHIPPETVYPHSFRHRFAKNFLERFNDISLLADLMGHESIETTRIYLTRSTKEQKELIDRLVTW